MIELKRLKLINWHNFENVTFDCARLTYMIGVNAVGKTTILDAIRYCLTTNRNFNALGNKKSGRTLQGSVHAKQRGKIQKASFVCAACGGAGDFFHLCSCAFLHYNNVN